MDALNLFFERSNAMQTYWNFYITIVLARLAFFGAHGRDRITAVLLTVAFIGFAVVNYGGVTGVAQQRLDVCRHLANRECVAPVTIEQPIVVTLSPPRVWEVGLLHISGDVLVIGAVWFLTLRRKPQSNSATAGDGGGLLE